MNALLLLISLAAAPTLQDFFASAEKVNVDKRISTEQVARAAAEFKQAWLALLPSVTLTGSYTRNQFNAEFDLPDFTNLATPPRRVVIQPFDSLAGQVRFELPLLFASGWARSAATAAAQEAAGARDKLSLDNTRRNVVIAYYGYVAALSLLESARSSLGTAQALHKLVEIRRTVGTAVELDVLRAKAEVERTNQIIADGTVLVAVSARSLRTLSGIEPPAAVELGADDMRPEPSVEELEASLDQLPLVLASDWDYKAARRMKLSSILQIVPLVGAQFTEQVTNYAGFTGQKNSWNAGFFLTWRLDGPTFATMAQQSAIAAASEIGAEKARLQSRDQIYADWQHFTAARTKVQTSQALVDAANKASSVAGTRYNLGAATQLDFIQATRDAFVASVSQIQARTDLAVARASLRISSGRPLE